MKFLKGFGLFFIYPLIMLGVGFISGIMTYDYFYPGAKEPVKIYVEKPTDNTCDTGGESKENLEAESFLAVTRIQDTLNADTEYILREMNVLDGSVVETKDEVPSLYLGMDREQFLAAMEQYAAYPPLAETERGFIGLDVVSFSSERVVIQMNYQYIQPSRSFYLGVANHEIVVLLEDKKTIYINTGICLEELPEEVQLDIMDLRFVESEEKLYNFLEAYSS